MPDYTGPDRRQTLPVPPSAFPWWVLPGLALAVLVIFAGALAASCILTDDTLRTQMFTGAYGLATLSVGYFFGSSAGSTKKDDAIAATAIKANETIADQGKALAATAPTAVAVSQTMDPGPPATATATATSGEPAMRPPAKTEATS